MLPWMGCGNSRARPHSARSWMAADGWITDDFSTPKQKNVDRTNSGRILVSDEYVEKGPTGEESQYQPKETRQLTNYPLEIGINDEKIVIERVQRLRQGEHYKDDDFPPHSSSLFYSGRDDPRIVWKAPKELCAQPKLLVDGMNRHDIMQGALGDCWFLSSCAAVCQRKEFIDKIVPERQVLYSTDYKGVVRLRFWRFGKWVDVFVDDYLPTKDGSLIYARDADPNEFWVSLLEKAYAKLHGSYEAIEGGQSKDALVDLTGGIAERYELNESTQNLYQKLARAAAAGAFITCSRKGNWRSNNGSNEVDANGLVSGHAYTVTDVKRIKRTNGAECLIRIRNPWGIGEEWKGAWSDRDHRWQLVDNETKSFLQFVEKRDGEFWMSFRDFCKEFQEVTICTIGPDFNDDGVSDAAGQILIVYGKWESNRSAGGCRNDLPAFATNPQFLLTVYEHDEHDPSRLPKERPKVTCSVIVALMQEHRRNERHTAIKMLQIGFIIYRTENDDKRLTLDHFMYNYETAKSGTYVNFREVCGRFEFAPGHYIIIPSTYNKAEPGEFMLRVFSNKRVGLRELIDSNNRNNGNSDYDHTIIPPPVAEAPSGQYPYDPHNGIDYEKEWQPAFNNERNFMRTGAYRGIQINGSR